MSYVVYLLLRVRVLITSVIIMDRVDKIVIGWDLNKERYYQLKIQLFITQRNSLPADLNKNL